MTTERETLRAFAEGFYLAPELDDEGWATLLVEAGALPADSDGEHRTAREWVRRLRAEIDDAGLRVEWQPEPDRIGIACSGGGVRAATYCLGALQALSVAGKFSICPAF